MKHIQGRLELIIEACRNKEVLDVGSTGQTSFYDLWPNIKPVAKSITGIDVVAHDDEPSIVQGNMEDYEFKKKFDVIVVGDTIEHVHNQGLFLANIRKHLKDNGQLIITTPNAKWLTVMLKPNPTHVIWHDQYTLSYMLEESGFSVEEFYYYLGNKKYPFYKKPIVWRQGMLTVCSKNSNFKKAKPEKVMVG